MNVFPATHIEHLRSKKDVFWHNGPPPEVLESEQVPENAGWYYGRKAVAFLASLERTHSIRASKQAVDMDNFTYSTLVERSAWFCETINRLAAEMTHEIRLTAHAKAVGYVEMDEATGLPVADASGKVVHRGGSVPLTLALMDASSVESGFLRSEVADFPDPLLPSNVDAHRQQQLNVLHRAMLALQPQVDAGDRQAIDTLIKLQDQVSKLSGTHAPKQNVTYIGSSDAMGRLSDEQLEAIAHRGLDLVQQADGTYEAEE